MFHLENCLFPNILGMCLPEVVGNVLKNGRFCFIPPILMPAAHSFPLLQFSAHKQCLCAFVALYVSLASYTRVMLLHRTQPTQQHLPFCFDKLRIYTYIVVVVLLRVSWLMSKTHQDYTLLLESSLCYIIMDCSLSPPMHQVTTLFAI